MYIFVPLIQSWIYMSNKKNTENSAGNSLALITPSRTKYWPKSLAALVIASFLFVELPRPAEK